MGDKLQLLYSFPFKGLKVTNTTWLLITSLFVAAWGGAGFIREIISYSTLQKLIPCKLYTATEGLRYPRGYE